jgi:hypothetical protein
MPSTTSRAPWRRRPASSPSLLRRRRARPMPPRLRRRRRRGLRGGAEGVRGLDQRDGPGGDGVRRPAVDLPDHAADGGAGHRRRHQDSKDSWQDYADSATISSISSRRSCRSRSPRRRTGTRTSSSSPSGRLRRGRSARAMGVQGAGLVAQMANSTDAEMQRMAGLLRQDAANGSAGRAHGAGSGHEGHGRDRVRPVPARRRRASRSPGHRHQRRRRGSPRSTASPWRPGSSRSSAALGKQTHLVVGGMTGRGTDRD